MRRSFTAIAIGTAAALAVAAPASAAPPQVTHLRNIGTNASAGWATESAGKIVETYIGATAAKKGAPVLDVYRMTARLNSEGMFLGGVQTIAHVSGGFTFTYDAKKFTKAAVNAVNLPATTCNINQDGKESGCRTTTLSITASWTGVGPISKGSTVDRYSTSGFKMVMRYSGTNREATVSATMNGKQLTGFQGASIGTYRELKTSICRIPGGCEVGL